MRRVDTSNEACRLCEILSTRMDDRVWYDVSLYEDDDFVVIPGLGPQANAYVLVVPRVHVLSVAQLSARDLRQLGELTRWVRSVVASAYGPVVTFEHGSCDTSSRGGSCIDHAHVHVVATTAPLATVVKEKHSLDALPSLDGLASAFDGTAYLYVEDQQEVAYAGPVPQLPGQHMRRVLAELHGTPDEWDYDMFPELSRISEMIKVLAPLFAAK